jgi:hypothetical protein
MLARLIEHKHPAADTAVLITLLRETALSDGDVRSARSSATAGPKQRQQALGRREVVADLLGAGERGPGGGELVGGSRGERVVELAERRIQLVVGRIALGRRDERLLAPSWEMRRAHRTIGCMTATDASADRGAS